MKRGWVINCRFNVMFARAITLFDISNISFTSCVKPLVNSDCNLHLSFSRRECEMIYDCRIEYDLIENHDICNKRLSYEIYMSDICYTTFQEYIFMLISCYLTHIVLCKWCWLTLSCFSVILVTYAKSWVTKRINSDYSRVTSKSVN